jgi:hypothetical protein
MKLLYTDVYAHSINPSHRLTAAMAAGAADEITFYGPGFSSAGELESGVLAFAERTGPYDAVMVGPATALLADTPAKREGSARYWTRFAAQSSTSSRILAYYQDIQDALPRLPARRRIAALSSFDYYAATARHTDLLDALDADVIASDAQFVPTLEQLPEWVWQEGHFQRKRHMISSEWNKFLTRRADRVLSLPHFVSEEEVSFRGLGERRNRIAVPGVEYVQRARALKALHAHGIRPGRKWIFHLWRAADHARLPAFSRYVPLRLYNNAFLGNLMDSRFVFTAPEGFGITVRKFFEIPAAGALMLCMPPIGFEALGFRAGEHYVGVAPEALPEAVAELERDPDRAQAIASAGRMLVFEQHTLRHRIRQLAACFAAMDRGQFAGSDWSQGQFRVHPGPEAAVHPQRKAALT